MSSPSNPYISKKEVNASYRPKGYGLSPGLIRARRRFRIRNALTGLAIASFAVGVWAYSISAVKQDNFDDADEEARALAGARQKSLESARPALTAVDGPAQGSVGTLGGSGPLPPSGAPTSILSGAAPDAPRGVLAALVSSRYPRFLDPKNKTFVWGAPPVDKLGRLGDAVGSRAS